MAIAQVHVDDLQQRCAQLATKLLETSITLPTEQRILVAISGIPGAGKSTVTDLVVQQINNPSDSVHTCTNKKPSLPLAAAVPMDGFHLTRAQLRQMPDPELATHRRGAAFTYDSEAYLKFVQRLREPMTGNMTVMAPSFDHAVKDPIENDIMVLPSTRIVLIEGNYCALNREPWSSAAKLLDELWFVDVDRDVARKRLARRHVQSGVTPDIESAHERILSTDFLNADDIVENMLDVQEIIKMS